MPLTALAAILCFAPRQEGFKEAVTVRGFHLFARCWRTPTGETPYMIWTIGSHDAAPEGEQWMIRGEYVAFEGLPIQPTGGFSRALAASDPDKVAGSMVEQPGGEDAKVAVIRGHLDKVETLVESLPLGDVTLVRAKHKFKEDAGPMFHIKIDHAMKLTTPSGITIEIPKQGADTNIKYAVLSFDPMVALTFKPGFKETEDRLPNSPLWKKLGGQVQIEARLKGLQTPSAGGFIGSSYTVQSKGFGLEAGLVKGASIEIIQTIVLQSYPVDFRVPVRESKR